jgi:hypothetical protein
VNQSIVVPGGLYLVYVRRWDQGERGDADRHQSELKPPNRSYVDLRAWRNSRLPAQFDAAVVPAMMRPARKNSTTSRCSRSLCVVFPHSRTRDSTGA